MKSRIHSTLICLEKRIRVLGLPLLISCLALGGASESLANSYNTNFGTAENPLKENGNWTNGKTDGLDWADVVAADGLASGTESGNSGYDDSTAILTGTWGPDQTAEATVHSVNQSENIFEEVELRLRSAISAHRNTGYEINFRCSTGAGRYVQVVRWNGAIGDFTYINSTAGPGLNNGDVVKASIKGNVITVYVNNTQVLQVTDSAYATGNPGIGFYLQGASGVNRDYGFSSFTASDGSAAPVIPPSNAKVTITVK